MHTSEAIHKRRSIKRYTTRELSRDEIEALLEAAALAPNHRLTQPWRFYVLGPAARHAYGAALGERKARKIDDPALAQKTRDTTAAEHRALPLMLAVAVVKSDNPEIAEEDYAAAMMAIQNLSLAAVERGLGTHIKTGAIMDDPAARAAVGVPETERIVAIVNIGEPAEIPPPKNRRPAAAFTTWVP
jgi:nitroreductase